MLACVRYCFYEADWPWEGFYVCFTICFVHFISARVWLCILSCFRYGFYEADWPGPICLVKTISQTRQNTQPSPCINKTNKIFRKTVCVVCDIVCTRRIGPGRILCLLYYLACLFYECKGLAMYFVLFSIWFLQGRLARANLPRKNHIANKTKYTTKPVH